MNWYEIDEIYESTTYINNEDVDEALSDEENEQINSEYFRGDFWIDCDYLLKNGKQINIINIGNEIFVWDIEAETGESDPTELTDEDRKLIEAFYDDDKFKKHKESGTFSELSTWSMDIDKSHEKMYKASLSIRYRGGSGYSYGWWILRK